MADSRSPDSKSVEYVLDAYSGVIAATELTKITSAFVAEHLHNPNIAGKVSDKPLLSPLLAAVGKPLSADVRREAGVAPKELSRSRFADDPGCDEIAGRLKF